MRKKIMMPAAFICAVLLLAGQTGCKNRFLYYPVRAIIETPDRHGLAYEDLYFTAIDGIRLNGWWLPVKNSRGTVLFCHGNGGNISYMLDRVRIYHSLKLNVLFFDYRGYGLSGGEPTEEGTYRDAAAAWDYLVSKKRILPERIVVIGWSLGGPVAAWLCRTRNPGALVLESTFTSAADVAAGMYPHTPVRLIFGDTYNTAGFITRVRCPVLVVHSPEDDIIPYQLGQRLFRLAPGRKEFLVIHGSHNGGYAESVGVYMKGLDLFFSKYIQ